MRNVKPKKFIVFLRGIEPVTDVIFLKWSLRNLNKIQSSKYSRTVVRAPDRCMGGHGFDSRRGLRFFLCPTLMTN